MTKATKDKSSNQMELNIISITGAEPANNFIDNDKGTCLKVNDHIDHKSRFVNIAHSK